MIKSLLTTLYLYYSTLWYYYKHFLYNASLPLERSVNVYLYSLSLINRLWSADHYRNGTFQQDMVNNLNDVCIPGTGFPLSVFCRHKIVFNVFLFVIHPVMRLCAAVYIAKKNGGRVDEHFLKGMLDPEDWFSLWRLNCRVASYHAGITGDIGYDMENKWKFLKASEENDIAVSPFLDFENIVCKHVNQEGGLGINFFSNAKFGGDWIIQEVLKNSDFVESMLPEGAPLSTIRIVTGSKIANGTAPYYLDDSWEDVDLDDYITVFSGVFRAGLDGARTDHVSILFDIDLDTGVILNGTTNNHWYKKGITNLFNFHSSTHNITHHPDNNAKVTGKIFEDIEKMKSLCQRAHMKLLKNVPLAGWDVALTQRGILLLEVNLSCNFFRGTLDKDEYYTYLHNLFIELEEI